MTLEFIVSVMQVEEISSRVKVIANHDEVTIPELFRLNM